MCRPHVDQLPSILLPICCDQTPDKKPLQGEGVYFGLQSEGRQFVVEGQAWLHWGQEVESRQRVCEVIQPEDPPLGPHFLYAMPRLPPYFSPSETTLLPDLGKKLRIGSEVT